MKNKLSRIIALMLVVLMMATALLPLTSCTPDTPTPGDCESHIDADGNGLCDNCNEQIKTDGDPETATYTVAIESVGGLKMDGITVYIHDAADPNEYASIGRAKTDKNGIATFTLSTDKTYTVELDNVKDGYRVEKRYNFSSSRTASIKLMSAPITDETLDDLDDDFYYELGDVIHDFSITDVNGKEWNVSDVLKEQQLLVLNMWYITCSPCLTEFPYLSAAYSQYNAAHGNNGTNIVEIFAINDHGDPRGEIESFAKEPWNEKYQTYAPHEFPIFKAENSGYESGQFISKFFEDRSAAGYPVSVFIDRYGVICCIEVGALTNSKYWTNAFDHFTSDNYKQQFVEYIEELTPIEKPNVPAPTPEEIDAAITGNRYDTGDKIEVEYHHEQNPEDAEYAWPFVVTTLDGVPAIKPSNYDKDGSFAIVYADVYLKAGDALVFDYFSSTESEDVLYVIVDGKDIYSISGMSEYDENGKPIWETCCTYVAQYDGWYEVGITYLKDVADYVGDDAVYISNLRVVEESEIDVETYIFRYAAFNPTEDGTGFNGYADVVLGADGYYHVGTANGPLLFANLLGYTNYDSGKTVFERAYANTDDYGTVIFNYNGENVFIQFEKYGTYASNSNMYGYTPVTEELRNYLIQYTSDYRRTVGKAASENLWLQLCCYYDAYGTDGKQLENPIMGLSAQSAYDIELDTPVTVTYDRILIPRGYLYKFVPTVSGVYRVTSDCSSSVVGWIYVGDDTEWAALGSRILLTDSNEVERLCPDLTSVNYQIVCPNCEELVTVYKKYDEDGNEIVPTSVTCHNAQFSNYACPEITDLSGMTEVVVKDYRNISIPAYFEAGVPYYIAVAYHTVEEFGSFEFSVKYESESFDVFVQASPGPFTYDIVGDEQIGTLIAGGIDAKLCNIDGCEACREVAIASGSPETTKYYHSVNADGSLGYVVFADFYQYTSVFQSQSVLDLIEIGAFNFGVVDGDYTEEMRAYATKMLNEPDHPERQGCVAVDKQLAEILQLAIHHHVFEDVLNGWMKFCYYYKELG